ncbi:MAG: hypothetical protein ACKV2V_11955, partial [Blastocatellia bacterium]
MKAGKVDREHRESHACRPEKSTRTTGKDNPHAGKDNPQPRESACASKFLQESYFTIFPFATYAHCQKETHTCAPSLEYSFSRLYGKLCGWKTRKITNES